MISNCPEFSRNTTMAVFGFVQNQTYSGDRTYTNAAHPSPWGFLIQDGSSWPVGLSCLYIKP